MTIERHESHFVIFKKKPVVLEPGTTEILEKSRLSGVGRQVYIQDHDTVIIQDIRGIMPDVVLYKTQINESRVSSMPISGLDMFTGTVRKYVWKPGVPAEEKVREERTRTALKLQLRKA